MKKQPALDWLIPLIALLAIFAAGIGLFYQDGGSAYTFTTLRGQAVQIYGRGLYRYDTIMTAAGFKGVDVVTLVVGLPLLLVSYVFYRRGSTRGGLLLASTLTYFLYIGASMTFSAAFNSLFLVYVALFSAGLFAFVTALSMFDMGSLAERLSNRLPLSCSWPAWGPSCSGSASWWVRS